MPHISFPILLYPPFPFSLALLSIHSPIHTHTDASVMKIPAPLTEFWACYLRGPIGLVGCLVGWLGRWMRGFEGKRKRKRRHRKMLEVRAVLFIGTKISLSNLPIFSFFDRIYASQNLGITFSLKKICTPKFRANSIPKTLSKYLGPPCLILNCCIPSAVLPHLAFSHIQFHSISFHSIINKRHWLRSVARSRCVAGFEP
jgi:hypothetical protein